MAKNCLPRIHSASGLFSLSWSASTIAADDRAAPTVNLSSAPGAIGRQAGSVNGPQRLCQHKAPVAREKLG
jgi:hypothetical protein